MQGAPRMLQGVPRTQWQLEDRPLVHGETRLIAELADVAVDFCAGEQHGGLGPARHFGGVGS